MFSEERTRMPGTPPMRFNNILMFPSGVNLKIRWRGEMAIVGFGVQNDGRRSASFEERTRMPGTPDPF